MKLGIVFFLAAAAETAQYFGIPALGSTFDPLDYCAYAAGAAAAAIIDIQVFTRFVSRWSPGQ